MSASTREYLNSLLVEEHGLSADEFDDQSLLFSSGLLDSFVLIDVIASLERHARIKIPAGELRLENIDSISRLEALVYRLQRKASG
jgi:acyl carrier protein